MARGWESKSVESQMDSAAAARIALFAQQSAPTETPTESKKNGLMLTRTRVLHDISTACNARYRQQLEQALAFLDQQIAELN
jgi:hypothetical protein